MSAIAVLENPNVSRTGPLGETSLSINDDVEERRAI
jgi:hypothetical protein